MRARTSSMVFKHHLSCYFVFLFLWTLDWKSFQICHECLKQCESVSILDTRICNLDLRIRPCCWGKHNEQGAFESSFDCHVFNFWWNWNPFRNG
jgi:hypothetical protein